MTAEGRPRLLGRPVPDSFPVTRLTIPPRSARVTEAALWAESLVVVQRGDVEVESTGGARETFHPGDVLCLEWVGVRVLRNHGADEAEVVSIRRFDGDSDEREQRMKFRTTIAGTGTNTAGIPVPDDVMAALNAGKKPAVRVRLGSHTYRSSVATVDGAPMISLSAANRAAAGVAAGDEVDVEVELDTAPREVEVPADFAAALDAEPDARRTFDALSYSNKRWHVETVSVDHPSPDAGDRGRMPGMSELATDSPLALDRATLEPQMETHRTELTAYCYRMLGSAFEAEDAVQETLLRAWRSLDRFEGRAQLRSWLYRIATNVCLDMLGSRQRRARPMDLEAASRADRPLPAPLVESAWIEPVPDARVLPSGGDPAEVALQRESIRLAFMAALQHLPAKQRVVLILREVLRWRAAEVAELLETSVASVNSALQRARATLDEIGASAELAPANHLDEASTELLQRYVQAFESYDMEALTALLHEDATWNMPPYALWLNTHDDIVKWCLGPGIGCQGSRLIETRANGSPAWGQYKPAPGGGWEPWSLQVLEARDGRISGLTFFLDTARWFPLFGLPPHLDA